jgi:AcrR family transcriptional regulator
LKQDSILAKAFEMFKRYGIRSVTMDDIARELGISKKTLYQSVENKADLLEQIFRMHMREERAAMEEIRKATSDAVEEMLGIGRYVVEKVSGISPNMIYDLQKYYQPQWRQMKAEMQEHVYSVIIDNLQRGIEQGLYRRELSPTIVARLYVGKSLLATEEDTLQACQGDAGALHQELVLYHMYGIASARGRQLLEKHIAAERQGL